MTAAGDSHERVRLEAIVAASYLGKEAGLPIVEAAKATGISKEFQDVYNFAVATLNNAKAIEEVEKVYPKGLLKGTGKDIVVQVNCVKEAIKFDVASVELPAGRKIKVILNNPDIMQHNLLVVKPGTADKVANEAIAMGAEGPKKGYIPSSSDILATTKLLEAGEKQTIEVTFDKPGKYPFICSFPGHALQMRGVFIVK